MDSDSERAHNKKSLLSIGVLMLSLAALQSPLWRAQQAILPVAVRTGGATLISADRSVDQVRMDPPNVATADVVGDREVLLRGKALGEARLMIFTRDGRTVNYHVRVQAEAARSFWNSLR